MQLEDGITVGRYSVIRRLGQGGMSNVYLAEDPENKREVVLKFPHEGLLGDITSNERFSREVKIGQLLHHPHIQQMYELAEAKGAQYLVLEYVPGVPLRDRIRSRHNHRTDQDFEDAVKLGVQIGDALAYAHSQHVSHRDLKPENVIVTDDGTAKVMDFGIALLRGARRITWGPLSNQVGTPDYMSPEQIQGSRGDERTDVYALGMILYEFVAGRLPYEGDNPLSIMNQHVNLKPPQIKKFRKDVPPALEEIILKAIRRKPAERWTTMQDFVAALKDWSTVDVDALRAQREAEADDIAGSNLAAKAGVSMSPTSLLTAIVIIVLFVAFVVLGDHFAAHRH
ncbi:MAG: serine/threonine protein kinase [Capsulimonadaceae bacterium]